MGRTVLYVAQSLDGFIADADGGVRWLEPYETPDEDYGYAEFLAGVDALVMGARTYRQILEFGEWPYRATPAWVLTHHDQPVPQGADVRFSRGAIREVLRDIAADTPGDLWVVGGADLVAQFLDEGLLDELILFVAPVVLGGGVRLFPSGRDLALQLSCCRQFDNGMVELRYQTLA